MIRKIGFSVISAAILLTACGNKEIKSNTQDYKKIIQENNAYSNIKWVDFNNLDNLMSKTPKKIMIYFYRHNCPYCKEMKETTFKNKEVIKLLNDNFYCVMFNGRDKEDIYLNGIKYINPDKDIKIKSNHEVHTALVDPYKKNIYWPSTVFLNEKYEKLRSWPGLQKENQFPRVIQMMMKR